MHYDHHFQRCCPAQTPDQFGHFQRLPAEIRNMIWEYSLPEARVYEVLDAPNAKQRTPAQKGLMFANVHPEPPPALAAVCRESRYFVMHQYKPLTLGTTTKFVDLSRDILLLEPYLLVKRLHRTLHFMSQIPLVRDNINRLALGTSYGVYTGICHPVLSWKVSKNNMGKLLSSLAKFPKLKMLVFIVHQEFQFEFDFRFPGTMTPIPNQPLAAPAPNLSHGHNHNHNHNHSHSATGYPSPVSSSGNLPSPPAGYPSPASSAHGSSPTRPGASPSPPSHTSLPQPSQLALPPGLPPTHPPLSATATLSPLIPRPTPPHAQLVHQAYRFKFDIEANINHTPRRPHLNELLYYPLDIDEDKDDWDVLHDLAAGDDEGGEWCDPWPTNDDWRRFRRRFQRAIALALELEARAGGEDGEAARGAAGGKGRQGQGPQGQGQQWRDASGGGGGVWCARDRSGPAAGGGPGGPRGKVPSKMHVPALKGASLLWRYTRGGYV
ncbi:hypothetical protein B0T25DRAFT_594696 [Lasiosphaeria hispida]|uniref:2EXR domain-containing protein n=1 Tax=Lasiosphaeria hispida TaxID=260671 RepID=A0AAJ0HSZ0_9PEZI|nr:hypothetical protein B0T25DRAFT_594696 [Lasiosphaeria hispida]